MLMTPKLESAIQQEVNFIVGSMWKLLREGDAESPSLLEQTYLAGLVATEVGREVDFGKFSLAKVATLLKKRRIVKTEEDQAQLDALMEASSRWMAGIEEELTRKIRMVIATADQEWFQQLLLRDSTGELKKGLDWETLRDAALAAVLMNLSDVLVLFQGVMDRFAQTELAKFFQWGQVSRVERDELVYKVPRPTACDHCMRLHLNADGSAKVYEYKEVLNNSNVGKRANAWKFTIGPVHPHCYCILHRVETSGVFGPNKEMAAAREFTLTATKDKKWKVLQEARARYAEAVRLAEGELE